MKLLKIFIIPVAAALFGCTDYPIYDLAQPVSKKSILLITDWTNRGSNIDIPTSYTVKIGDSSTTLSGTTNSVENLFADAGQYTINVWNTVDNITVSDKTATADYKAGELGWFFTGKQEVTIKKDSDYSITVPMQQQVRQLTLKLDITGDAKDYLKSINASLSGVAGTLNIDNGTHGTPADVALTFYEDPSDGTRKATIRLLGMTDKAQTLTLALSFSGGDSSPYILNSDMSSLLAGFNEDKKTPLTLSTRLVATLADEEFTATISNWIPGDASTGIAE